jgi:DEAD/DEAH box helicase domain-containing protein
MDALLRRALALAAQTCCEQGCYECIAATRCSSPFLDSGERRPTDKAATRAFLSDLLGVTPDVAAPALTAPPAAPVAPDHRRPDDWVAAARALLELHGLTMTEVSSKLGVPSRELQRALVNTSPLRVRHAKFGVGTLLSGSGSGERREALVYFPGFGQKRLLLSQPCWTSSTTTEPPKRASHVRFDGLCPAAYDDLTRPTVVP